MDRFVLKNGKRLRCGYTTGSCSAGAARAAAMMLLGKEEVKSVTIDTPAGISVELDIEDICIESNSVACAVVKDSGDDPDVTNGMKIYARVEKVQSDNNEETNVSGQEASYIIEGGEGVGRVTRPGLDQPVGEAAINSTPRKMIIENLQAVADMFAYKGGFRVTLSIPGGREIAHRTFNPRMGIEGGISIIGTTGIVEPMSNEAVVKTTAIEIGQRFLDGNRKLVITPGKIGSAFASKELGMDSEECVLCSNNIGDAFEEAIRVGFRDITLIGHIGKLVKLGYGAWNTHSASNDGRMEELIRCALLAGGDRDTLLGIEECVTTDGALSVLQEADILDATMDILGDRIMDTLVRWCGADKQLSVICFTNAADNPRILIRRKWNGNV